MPETARAQRWGAIANLVKRCAGAQLGWLWRRLWAGRWGLRGWGEKCSGPQENLSIIRKNAYIQNRAKVRFI